MNYLDAHINGEHEQIWLAQGARRSSFHCLRLSHMVYSVSTSARTAFQQQLDTAPVVPTFVRNISQ